MRAVVFDCDGVLVDSERIGNVIFADLLTRAGLPATAQDCVDRYLGRSTVDCVAEVERVLGRPAGFDLGATFEREMLARLPLELTAIAGVQDVLDRLAAAEVPVCVASSGRPAEIALRLAVTGLERYFGQRCYSASMVARGKPAPDLFLHAAAELGVDPAECVLIEDSPFGVAGGRAAGMTVIGYADLVAPGVLRAAGADHVVSSMAEVSRYL